MTDKKYDPTEYFQTKRRLEQIRAEQKRLQEEYDEVGKRFDELDELDFKNGHNGMGRGEYTETYGRLDYVITRCLSKPRKLMPEILQRSPVITLNTSDTNKG